MKPEGRMLRANEVGQAVKDAVARVRVDDIHSHLYDPAFGSLLLWGIDDLLVYHYLVAEAFRYLEMPYADFWRLSKERQAEVIWEQLFLKHSPVSESCRGVLTTLNRLGLEVGRRDLKAVRKWYAKWRAEDYADHCLELAGVERVWMTNSPFDDEERPVWERGFRRRGRFMTALRIDPLLLDWKGAGRRLRGWGYEVSPGLGRKTMAEVRRFLRDWAGRIEASYMMISLPPDFEYPGASETALLIEGAVLPECADLGLPFAMMPGVKRGVNPELRLAGDAVAPSRLESVEALCSGHPANKFLATVLAREDQHRLCVIARKFRNLHIFGCWWFMNIPSLVEEITRLRLELLGLSVTLQHSDARVLDQLLYKWDHSRAIVGRVLAGKYEEMAATGWRPTAAEIERDVREVFGGGFGRFLGERGSGSGRTVA